MFFEVLLIIILSILLLDFSDIKLSINFILKIVTISTKCLKIFKNQVAKLIF